MGEQKKNVRVSIIHARKPSRRNDLSSSEEKKFRQMIIGMFGCLYKWQCLHHILHNGLSFLCAYSRRQFQQELF